MAYEVLNGAYHITETIGSGGFAKVKLGYHLATGDRVAIKMMDKKALGSFVGRIKIEIEAMKQLNHQNICKLYQVLETEDYFYLILEYCQGGELFDYIVSKDRLSESEARTCFRQIVAAVAYLHHLGFAHRDLKPENLLLDEDQNIKLIDFGLCTMPHGMLSKTFCGSPAYAAPELIARRQYNGLKADMWSLGVLLYTLLCGFLPFNHESIAVLYKLISAGKYDVPKWLSSESVNLLGLLLHTDPHKRVSIRGVVAHPWMNRNYLEHVQCVTEQKSTTTRHLDEDCITEMSLHYGLNRQATRDMVAKWAYDSTTATYLLLCRRKLQGRPLKLLSFASVHYSPASSLYLDDEFYDDEEEVVGAAGGGGGKAVSSDDYSSCSSSSGGGYGGGGGCGGGRIVDRRGNCGDSSSSNRYGGGSARFGDRRGRCGDSSSSGRGDSSSSGRGDSSSSGRGDSGGHGDDRGVERSPSYFVVKSGRAAVGVRPDRLKTPQKALSNNNNNKNNIFNVNKNNSKTSNSISTTNNNYNNDKNANNNLDPDEINKINERLAKIGGGDHRLSTAMTPGKKIPTRMIAKASVDQENADPSPSLQVFLRPQTPKFKRRPVTIPATPDYSVAATDFATPVHQRTPRPFAVAGRCRLDGLAYSGGNALSPSLSYDSHLNNLSSTANTPNRRQDKGTGALARDRTPLRGRVAEVFGSLERGMDRLVGMLTPKKKTSPPVPRTAKATNNVSNVRQMHACNYLCLLCSLLTPLNISFKKKGFTLKCNSHDRRLTFTLEVVRLAGQEGMVGVLRKRVKGSSWQYKSTCQAILNSL